MPLEVLKIVGIAIIAFGLGTSFVQGRQVAEINDLNSRIKQLEKQLSERETQLKTAQNAVKKQNQKVDEFYKLWQKK